MEERHSSLWFLVRDTSHVGEARRTLQNFASDEAGWTDVDVGALAIVVAELANNLLRHAQGGEMVARWLTNGSHSGVELIILDRGPGIADVAQSMTDGYSTTGGRGQGMGAVQRQAQTFEIYSQVGSGTVQVARIWPRGAPARRETTAVINVAYPGEEVCGDGWASWRQNGTSNLMVVDGLGHGIAAAQASAEAMRVFREHPSRSPVEAVTAMHAAMRHTRGATVGVMHTDMAGKTATYCGVGNISATVVNPQKEHRAISQNGTLGHEARRIQEATYPWSSESLLIMHSDGLQARWDLSRYPGLVQRDPALIGGVLFRDFRRERDDVTVMVAREPAAEGS